MVIAVVVGAVGAVATMVAVVIRAWNDADSIGKRSRRNFPAALCCFRCARPRGRDFGSCRGS